MRKLVTSGELLEILLLPSQADSLFSAQHTGCHPASSPGHTLLRTTDPRLDGNPISDRRCTPHYCRHPHLPLSPNDIFIFYPTG